MKTFCFGVAVLTLIALSLVPAPADSPYFWQIESPDHGQTFSYGTEQRRVWAQRSPDRHLVLLLDYTNDPFVDRTNPRQYDSFVFSFPTVRLGEDGVTFFYRAGDGRRIPVAVRRRDFLGIDEIHLSSHAELEIDHPHGYLTVRLILDDSTLPGA